ncbi:thioredoxin family protein [Leeuwenhoekiella sp. H156]|uniref:thioredoxin family protein n=1 Tax=Leeuwenhoekiella sp. H156 TaxID=3450128 RepID=UPI003FA48463
MKRIILLILIIHTYSLSFAQGVQFSGTDLDAALVKAKEENKAIFIDFYTSWCAPCKIMDKDVFTQKQVGDYLNSKFVNLKINAEKEGKDLAAKYGIRAYPTFVMLDKYGNLLHIFAGGILDGEKFINTVANTFDPQKAFGSLKQRVEAGDKNNDLQVAYLEALMNTHTENPEPPVNDFYNSLSDQEKISDKTLFIYEAFAPFGSEKAKFLEENRAQFRKVANTQKVDSILRSKYETYFGQIAQGYVQGKTLEDVNKTEKHVYTLDFQDLKGLPAIIAGAKLQLSEKGKDTFINQLNEVLPGLSDNEKDLMLYTLLPGLKKFFSQEEKQNLMGLVSNTSVQKYLERSLY